VIFDKFSGNFAASIEPLKNNFRTCLNVEMLTDDEMPGGFSKYGQPCDKLHALWRMLCDAYEAVALGYPNDVFRRLCLFSKGCCYTC
jgi:hypothetical protein